MKSMIDTPQTLPVPQRDADIEEFYIEARKHKVTVGNIQKTERGVFVQFTPRVGKRNGKYRTFGNLKDFINFLKQECVRLKVNQ